MDYENDIPTDEYEPELYESWYSSEDTDFIDYADEDYLDYDEFEYQEVDELIEYNNKRATSHWTPRQVVLILILVVLVAAILVFVILPWIQFTVAPRPLYMPPPSTPLSQL